MVHRTTAPCRPTNLWRVGQGCAWFVRSHIRESLPLVRRRMGGLRRPSDLQAGARKATLRPSAAIRARFLAFLLTRSYRRSRRDSNGSNQPRKDEGIGCQFTVWDAYILVNTKKAGKHDSGLAADS